MSLYYNSSIFVIFYIILLFFSVFISEASVYPFTNNIFSLGAHMSEIQKSIIIQNAWTFWEMLGLSKSVASSLGHNHTILTCRLHLKFRKTMKHV